MLNFITDDPNKEGNMVLLGLGSGQNARPLGTLLLEIGTIFFKLDFLAACVGPFDIQCNFFIKKRGKYNSQYKCDKN